MSAKLEWICDHAFHGGRFTEGRMPLDALRELSAYQHLVHEVAKCLWKAQAPSRSRLPPDFGASFGLSFAEIRHNCVVLPLQRSLSDDEQSGLFPSPEWRDSASVIASTIRAARDGNPLPEGFPRSQLSALHEYGKSLRDDEWIEQRLSSDAVTARHDHQSRAAIQLYFNEAYSTAVDELGQITMANLKSFKIAMMTQAGRVIEASIDESLEQIVIQALQERQSTNLRIKGLGEYSSDGALKRISKVESISIEPIDPKPVAVGRTLLEEFDEIAKSIPDSEWEKLPVDGASRHDHYLYSNRGGVKE
jgi:hypothetical protein